MQYPMSTAIYAVLIAFVANIALCPIFIPYLTKWRFGQQVREDGPQSHLKKAGTPTMGGIMIILSFILASFMFMDGNAEVAALVMLTVGFGCIGAADDYLKKIRRRSLGLRAWQKIALQVLIGGAFIMYCYSAPNFSTAVIIPFFPHIHWDLGYFYAPFCLFVILGTVNGANLTDGLDGMAAGVTALIAVFFIFAAWAQHSPVRLWVTPALSRLEGLWRRRLSC
jgi:phospho-N-acetylmuramoyl-pentapeptide-transferase